MQHTDVKLTELFLAQLDTESPRARHALECVPDGFDDWRPHESALPLGRLASLVAGIPFWLETIVNEDAVDLEPLDGPRITPPPAGTCAQRLLAFEVALGRAREAFERTTDEHLRQPWQLLERGRVVSENPRHVVLRETFIQLANYRSQLLVHMRLNERDPALSEALTS